MSQCNSSNFFSANKSFSCFFCLLLICSFLPVKDLSAQAVSCSNRYSIYDSLLLAPGGFPTNVCAGDTISIGMATLPNYFHVINGPLGVAKKGKGGEGNGGAISFESSVTSKNTGVYSAKVTKEGCPTLYSNYVILTYLGPKEFILSGGGFYCPGSTGKILQIDNSEIGSTYQLYRKGVNVGDPDVAVSSVIPGTGFAINFPAVSITGNYFVKAINATCYLDFGNEVLYNTVNNLQTTNIMLNSVNFSWDAIPGIIDYEWAVTTSSVPPVSTTSFTTNTSVQASGLFSSTLYYIYVRTQCSAGVYGDWTTISFTTGEGCVTAIPIDSCTQYTATLIAGNGNWNIIGGTPNYPFQYNTPGKELIYSFTPVSTGLYYLEVLSAPVGDPINPVHYFYKKAGPVCSDTGWTNITTVYQNALASQQVIGELQAGVKYYVLLDNHSIDAQSQVFQICKPRQVNCDTAQNITLCDTITTNISAGFGAWDFDGYYPYNSVDRPTPGKEAVYKFTPLSDGFYYLQIISSTGTSGYNIDYLYKPASEDCGNTGWIGIGRSNRLDAKSIGKLQANVPYYLLLDNESSDYENTQTFKICKADPPDCAAHLPLTACTPVTATIPPGFGAWDFSTSFTNNAAGYPTPGKESVYSFTPAVTGGYFLEVLSNTYGGYTDYLYKADSTGCNETGWRRISEINNTGGKYFGQLQAGIRYYILLDNENPYFGKQQTFQICKGDPPNCDTAKALTLCTRYKDSIPTGVGGWDFGGVYPNNSVGYTTGGKEAIFKFTATVSGYYYIEITEAPVYEFVDYLFKPDSTGCNDSGWTGIGRFANPGGKNFGPLQAGVQYYLVADKEGLSTTPGFSQEFKVCGAEVPNCSGPTPVYVDIPISETIPAGIGGWDFENISQNILIAASTPGKEKFYVFTPEITGRYFLNSGYGGVSYLFKPVSAGCTNSGWTVIPVNSNGAVLEKGFGPLQSGVSYYIIADNQSIDEMNFNYVISIQDRIICPGATTVFTAGPGYRFDWEVDEGNGFIPVNNPVIYSGGGLLGQTFTITNPPTSFYGYKYRCRILTNSFGGIIIYTEYKTLKFSNTWEGTLSVNWNEAANWSCGVLPDENTDVIIPAGTAFSPLVNANVSCRSVSIRNGAVLNVGTGYKLNITGKPN